MGHGAQFLGNCLMVFGGIYGEENKVLDDFAAYDITLNLWINIKQPKANVKNFIGPLSYHSLTLVLEPGISQ